MAKFEHRRYAGLVLQDEKGVWARFTPEVRTFGENQIKIGVLETDDSKVIERLRNSPDKNLVEIDPPKPKPKPKSDE